MFKLWRLRSELREAERKSREADKSYIAALERLVECDDKLIKVLTRQIGLERTLITELRTELRRENMFHPLAQQ